MNLTLKNNNAKTQFSLDQKLWNSDIGTKATKADTVSEWEHFAQNADATEAPKPPCRQNRVSSVKKSHPQQTYNIVEHKNSKLISPLAKLIKVPVEVLVREWNWDGDGYDDEDREHLDNNLNKWSQTVSGPAAIAMKRVDYTLKKLRQCASINTLQKSSLQVAVALLDLVSTKECQNPFLCLHHASNFASQGSKGGNNDEEFKKPLPEESECTPNQAISVIGRADCLRAIHFTDEAIFICSFVANVCRLHRDKKSALEWNSKWRVVAILMYTISVAIDATIYSFMEGEARSNALESWNSDVRAEISRARSDALALQKSLSRRSFNGKKKSPATSRTLTTPNENEVEDKDNSEHEYGDDYEVEDNNEAYEEDTNFNDRKEDANSDDNEQPLDNLEGQSYGMEVEMMSSEPPSLFNANAIPVQVEDTDMNEFDNDALEGDDETLEKIAFVPI